MNSIYMNDYTNYDDFARNFRINAPENYNFAFDCIDALAKTQPDKLAMIWCNDKGEEKRYTFSQLSAISDAAARFFLSIGIRRSDAVMLILKRRVQFWFALLGLMKIGAVSIPATHLLAKEDVIYRNNAASVAYILTTEEDALTDTVEDAMPESPTVRKLVKLGASKEGWLSFDDGVAAFSGKDEPIERLTQNTDMMMLYFTSGTTGLPKMVAHNFTYPLGHISTARYWHSLHPKSIHITLADTGWAKAAWGKLFGQWLCESTIMIYDHDYFDAHRFMQVISQYKVTSLCAPPTAYRVFITMNLQSYDLSSLEHVTSAGEPLNEEVFTRFKAMTGLSIYEAYGQTETTPLVMTTPYIEPRPGSTGKFNPAYDMVLVDEFGEEVGVGEAGEICVRAHPGDVGIYMGYYRDEVLTSEAWRGGLYHTGDIARKDEDGYIWYIGRSDDIIKSAGYRIGPFEVESVIMKHPAVLECAVTGVPNALRGSVVKASVILNNGYEATEKLKGEIRRFVKSLTSDYKCPRIIEFVQELPKTISGKVQRMSIKNA
ncbi:MAG: AMP-binding protein [Clostridiales Family XIII bacterium]|jgi:acetyl-CoA synthetase|nr:AMP-binding protein [Clostridiales Family XIII bacterium]